MYPARRAAVTRGRFRGWRIDPWRPAHAVDIVAPRTMSMPRLVVSAPFGNYVQPEGAVATLGTFTALRRPGRLWRILKTVRYYPRLHAWVNKIGLRNPGIGWLEQKVAAGRIDCSDKLVSVHGFSPDEWWRLLDGIAAVQPLAVELNMSCPNVGEIDWPEDLFARAQATGIPVIVKLPPVQFELMFERALEVGIRSFHACNTLPLPAGGLSGKPLKPVALQCIRHLHELAGPATDELRVVGGGGILTAEDVDAYAAHGVVAVAVGTKVMNPAYLLSDRGVRGIRARAEELLAGRPDLVMGRGHP
jgi:dihydroorotate dehydrogenase